MQSLSVCVLEPGGQRCGKTVRKSEQGEDGILVGHWVLPCLVLLYAFVCLHSFFELAASYPELYVTDLYQYMKCS